MTIIEFQDIQLQQISLQKKMEYEHNCAQVNDPESKGLGPVEANIEKIQKMEERQIKEDEIDNFIAQKTKMEDMMIKR